MKVPTCEEIWNGREDEFEQVHRKDDTSWRHGSYVWAVFKRISDNTFWCASYRESNDGETNELREGYANISQVKPVEKVVIDYVGV